MKNYCFIVNPVSRGGKNLGLRRSLAKWAEKNLTEPWVVLTEGPQHATELVRHAHAKGCTRIIAVGGDGTLHEVVNGLLELPEKTRPQLGVIRSGTGGDFGRMLEEDFPRAGGWEWLKRPKVLKADAGRCDLELMGGREHRRFFINIADVGISGEVTRRVNASSRALGSLEYLRSTLAAGWSYRPPRVRLKGLVTEGRPVPSELDLLILVVANGKYFGGGMCIAPGARIDDGKFFVVLSEKISYLTLLRELPKIYLKKHLKHPKIHYGHAQGLTLDSLDGNLPVGMDGEFLIARRVDFTVLPKALEILVPGLNGRRES